MNIPAFNVGAAIGPARSLFKRRRADPLPLLVERMGAFPSSGDIRLKVVYPSLVLDKIKALHCGLASALDGDRTEGLDVVFADWRFKLSVSLTKSEITLCVISRGDIALMQIKTLEMIEHINGTRC